MISESDKQFKKKVQKEALQVVRNYWRSASFTDRKLADIPTDALSVTNRKYVTLNGPTSLRPTSSVVGQFYLDTTIGVPIWYDGTSWIDANGNVA